MTPTHTPGVMSSDLARAILSAGIGAAIVSIGMVIVSKTGVTDSSNDIIHPHTAVFLSIVNVFSVVTSGNFLLGFIIGVVMVGVVLFSLFFRVGGKRDDSEIRRRLYYNGSYRPSSSSASLSRERIRRTNQGVRSSNSRRPIASASVTSATVDGSMNSDTTTHTTPNISMAALTPDPGTETCEWLNTVLMGVFTFNMMSASADETCRNKVETMFNSSVRPSYFDYVYVDELRIGECVPRLESLVACNSGLASERGNHEGGLISLEGTLRYEGGCSVALHTALTMQWPVPGWASLPVSLNVHSLLVLARVSITYRTEPSPILSISVLEDPLVEFRVSSSIGESNKLSDLSKISSVIRTIVDDAVRSHLIYPRAVHIPLSIVNTNINEVRPPSGMSIGLSHIDESFPSSGYRTPLSESQSGASTPSISPEVDKDSRGLYRRRGFDFDKVDESHSLPVNSSVAPLPIFVMTGTGPATTTASPSPRRSTFYP